MRGWLAEQAAARLSPGVFGRVHATYATALGLSRRMLARRVALDRLLWGGEHAVPAARYARITRNPLRPSTRLRDTPHVRFLQAYQREGERVLQPGRFEQTAYFANAAEALELAGEYFGCRRREELPLQARRFVAQFEGAGRAAAGDVSRDVSSPWAPVILRRIADSDGCYEIVDGHHRLAVAYVRGQRSCRAYVLRDPPVHTPLQEKLLDVFWTGGQRLIYQPVEAPELGRKWRLVRRCSDRLGLMQAWLAERAMLPARGLRYLDVGCSYGWFVREMGRLGFAAQGVDRDPAALELGRIVYGLSSEQLIERNIVDFLQTTRERFGVTSCFSVIHHFALGRGPIPAEALLGHLDRITVHALFFDTGQSHERWFRQRLPQWDRPFIQRWVREHSSFTRVTPLGEDSDWQLPGQRGNYGRTLFVCTRD
ncbi:MAG TPA: hypothetical protein ENK62_03680 [Chromatiales bacterium]|nr:hypothetical protein [Chromatiales bacterium]